MKRIDFVVFMEKGSKSPSFILSEFRRHLDPIRQPFRLIFVAENTVPGNRQETTRLSTDNPVVYIKPDPGSRAWPQLLASALPYITSRYAGLITSPSVRSLSQIGQFLQHIQTHHVVCLEPPHTFCLAPKKVFEIASTYNTTGLRTFYHTLSNILTELGYTKKDIPSRHLFSSTSRREITRFRDGVADIFAMKKPPQIPPPSSLSMAGAGVIHKTQEFVTHTTLHHSRSAIITFTPLQRAFVTLVLLLFATAFYFYPLPALKSAVGFLSAVYFIDIFFTIVVIRRSLKSPPEVSFSPEDLAVTPDQDLPVYTILCPLYKESAVLPQFVQSIAALDWPKDKLDVQLLLEEDDDLTLHAARALNLPSYFRIVVVPDSQPKTKPKACNYGLAHARGEYLVIYDAEDIPDPLQLKKAFHAFRTLPKDVRCLQAKLNYFNPNQNLLTKLFSIEYSLWFDVTLPGLQTLDTMIPLGGTSNHFRTADLTALKGWDPFNVTEDADLGVRLFKKGYRTAIIDSMTLEEANSSVSNWLRQRSRWIKGYMQTFLVHMRSPHRFVQDFGRHSLYFQMIVGGKLAFMIINPLMWMLTISYFLLRSIVGPTIESLYPGSVFLMAFTSLVIGNFLFVYCYMIGAAKREAWGLMKYVFLEPFYWLLVSVAAGIALFQLFFRPHYWEKTVHGLHLPRRQSQPSQSAKTQTLQKKKLTQRLPLSTGILFLAGLLTTYAIQFASTAFAGRNLSTAEYSTFALLSTIMYILQIIFVPFTRVMSHASAYAAARQSENLAGIRKEILAKAVRIGGTLTILWILALPVTTQFFGLPTSLTLFLFSPVLVTGMLYAVEAGYMAGNAYYKPLVFAYITESVTKLVTVFIGSFSGIPEIVYISFPVSTVLAYAITHRMITRNIDLPDTSKLRHEFFFPFRLFWSTMVSRATIFAFIGADILLATHYLDTESAGLYAMLSTVGKVIFLAGSLPAGFIIPETAYALGLRKKQVRPRSFSPILASIVLTGTSLYIVTVTGHIIIPLLFGEKGLTILPYLPLYAAGIAGFTVSSILVQYYQAKSQHIYAALSFVITLAHIAAITIEHDSYVTIAIITSIVGVTHFVSTVTLLAAEPLIKGLRRFGVDLYSLFTEQPPTFYRPVKLRLLVFNWRDTKHAYAGGAEVYVHEIAKQWVKLGHSVTVFSGNDGRSQRNEVVDGVQIIRRGGTYTVYFWAAIYYLMRLRKYFDVVIDCENGIPFFTPLFSRLPKFLVVFHVHKNVFSAVLPRPLILIAQFLELTLVPIVYARQKVITISPSSRKEIVSTGISHPHRVEIISPGVKIQPVMTAKTTFPSFVYLGRLKKYKNVDTILTAFRSVLTLYPDALLTIAGTGEMSRSLKRMAERLEITHSISFVGRVTESSKTKILSESWAALQPSSYEGWGLTVIEANAAGTPVIASNVPGLKDSVIPGKTGILVQSRNVDAFSQAMIQIIQDSESRGRLSRSARKWAQTFRWDVSAKQFIQNAYKEVSLHRLRYS